MRLAYRRLIHAIDNHGLRGTILRAIHRQQRDKLTQQPGAQPHPFDLRHNTDTSGYVPGEALITGSSADRFNTAYYAISPSSLTQAIAHLPIDPGEHTFVDLGCGKGRALLVAAHQHFKSVVGAELSPELASAAQRNTRTYKNVSIHIADAATVTYPAGPLVVFYYHPFLAPLLRKVLANMIRQSSGRRLYVLSANPGYPRVYARLPLLRHVWTKDIALSEEDIAADRHGITAERYTLWYLQN